MILTDLLKNLTQMAYSKKGLKTFLLNFYD